MRRLLPFLLFALLVVLPLVAAKRRAVVIPAPKLPVLDPFRSFAVTDVSILGGFRFERTLTALTAGSATTPKALFQQWFDTQNPKPGLAAADAPHCDDFLAGGQPSFNGFPRRCPTPEGALAAVDPFTPVGFAPIAIVNRFDLAPPDGSNCGQYRLIYAKWGPDRLHIIMEGVLPNPAPAQGLSACRPVAQFWAELSGVDSMTERRARLEGFFFQGLPGFSPVIVAANYAGAGGIRTSHLPARGTLRMYQFRTSPRCSGEGPCRLLMVPDTLENAASARLFDARADSPESVRFRDGFIGQIATLAIRDVNLYFLTLPAGSLLAESDPTDEEQLFNYSIPFLASQTEPAGQAFRGRIAAELSRLGSSLTPEEVVRRADTQSCAGCHLSSGMIGNGLTFPRSLSFEHVSEVAALMTGGEAGPATRFAISPAMRDVFIPHRMKILSDFLVSGKPPVHSNATIGGGRAVQ
jgi:hypothetical protein